MYRLRAASTFAGGCEIDCDDDATVYVDDAAQAAAVAAVAAAYTADPDCEEEDSVRCVQPFTANDTSYSDAAAVNVLNSVSMRPGSSSSSSSSSSLSLCWPMWSVNVAVTFYSKHYVTRLTNGNMRRGLTCEMSVIVRDFVKRRQTFVLTWSDSRNECDCARLCAAQFGYAPTCQVAIYSTIDRHSAKFVML
jgi:hypothetical protein